ncbi:MAG: lipopolysaccharide biosynthesis protein [Anaerolineales bacterium]
MKASLSAARHWFALTIGHEQPVNDSQRRYTRILQSALTALAGRGVALLVSIVSVPLTIGYLGVERYGVWITLSTLLTWLTLADLGLGNGLLNALSEAYGQNRPELAQRYVATTFWMLIIIATLAGLVLTLSWPWLDWAALFRVDSSQARAEIGPTLALAAALTLLNLPLGIGQRVLNAYQEGTVANYWAAAGNIASLIGVVLVSRSEGGLPALVLGFMGTQGLIALLSVVWLFRKHKPWLGPNWLAIDLRHWQRLFQTGIEFFVLQIATLVLFQTDNLVISYFLGADQVPGYSLVYRLFSYVLVLQALFLNPLWPAYAEAVSRDDWAWVRKTFRRTLLWGMLLAVFLIVTLLIAAQPIISLWTQGVISVSLPLVGLMALWTILACWGNTFAFLQNGLGRIRIQTVAGLCLACVNLGLSILWVQSFGVIGVIAATVVAYVCIPAWIVPVDVWLTLRRAKL